MAKYVKKPVIIDAVQWDGNADTANAFIGESYGFDWHYVSAQSPDIIIPTLEGDHLAGVGDWIIRGIKGEYYPCKSDVFSLTYEKVDE